MTLQVISQTIEYEGERETFSQDGVKAWNEYQAKGLHVTVDEANAWLGKLEE